MKLKSLEAIGFKSFADRTYLEFTDGITAIVGPNGSGKSNISDAIKWVLGEQSAKSLRGGNMQDVIFSGTQARKPVGFAEVTITFDNTDRSLPLDYDDVAITRRVFRSGESEYAINRTGCRLKDIHELMMDTGLGRDGYSMVGQGKIAEIASAKPEELRQMFEEAAGITKYRYRKEESERKLSHTQDNILRVNDIIGELELQIEPLRLQSEKAKKYLALRDELKSLEINLSMEQLAVLKTQMTEVAEQILANEADIAAAEKDKQQTEERTNALFEGMRADEEAELRLREKEAEQSEKLSGHQSAIAVLKSRQEQNEESIARAEREIGGQREMMKELDGQIYEREEELKGLLAEQEKAQQIYDDISAQLNTLAEERLGQDRRMEKLSGEMMENLSRQSEQTARISNTRTLSDNFGQRYRKIEEELAAGEKGQQEAALRLREAEEKLHAEERVQQEMLERRREIAAGLRELRVRREEAAASAQQSINKISSMEARHRVLSDLEKDFDGYHRSVKSLLQASEKGNLRDIALLGTVAQLVEVPGEYAVAMETALGGAMQNIITPSEEDAKRAIAYLKQNKLGRATFLPVSAAKGGKADPSRVKNMAGYIGIASELVRYEGKIEKVVEGLLGRVVVAEKIDHAIAMAKATGYQFRIVTLDGELLTPGGAMSGGSRNASASLFTRGAEMASLSEQIEAAKKERETLRERVSALDTEIAEQQGRLEQEESGAQAGQQVLITCQTAYTRASAQLQQIEENIASLKREQAELDGRLATLREDAEKDAQRLEELKTAYELLQEESRLLKEGSVSGNAAQAQLAEQQRQAMAQLGERNKDTELHRAQTEHLRQRRQEMQRGIDYQEENIEEMRERNEDMADDVAFKEEQIELLREEQAQVKAELAQRGESRRSGQEELQKLQADAAVVNERLVALTAEKSRLENKRSRAEEEEESIVSRLWTEYELTPSAAAEQATPLADVKEAQRRTASLRTEMKELGNINIDAIAEYENISERLQFLTGQRDDLVAAQKALETIIRDMTSIMRTQFQEKFDIIAQHFTATATELFGGGKAQLRLTDRQNVLESGVEIDFQPPGKAVKGLIALSGGEQALVSISLLFAILKVRPAPFCVLDEIEAALDDVNVFRFADYLKRYSQKIQFIIVTHRRGTMEVANTLYGVTMQEKGITRLLSLNIDEIENLK